MKSWDTLRYDVTFMALLLYNIDTQGIVEETTIIQCRQLAGELRFEFDTESVPADEMVT